MAPQVENLRRLSSKSALLQADIGLHLMEHEKGKLMQAMPIVTTERRPI